VLGSGDREKVLAHGGTDDRGQDIVVEQFLGWAEVSICAGDLPGIRPRQ
jgi:hypothetical protein